MQKIKTKRDRENSESKIFVYHIGTAKKVLGPGKRLIIWVSGCPHKCPGCSQKNLWDRRAGNPLPVKNILNIFKESKSIDGITISGGEPLAQAKELLELIKLFPKNPDKILFTGYRKGELNPLQAECCSYFDLIVSGRYVNNLKGDFYLRGSRNQKFYSPKDSYSKNQLKVLYDKKSAGLDIVIKDNYIYFYGIPTSKQEIKCLRQKTKLML